MFITPVDRGAAAAPVLPETDAAAARLIAVGIVGATVMPHAVYLQSALMQAPPPMRDEGERWALLRISNREVFIALALAGMVNMAMVMMASSAFHAGHSDVAEIETAYHTLTPLLGIGAAGVFLVSLIASGVAGSTVGTMAGQMIMQGFVGFRIPIWLRRLVTMVPAFVVVGLGVDATNALVVSQVVLSLALPLPMIALLVFTTGATSWAVRQRPRHPRRGGRRHRRGFRPEFLSYYIDARRADPGTVRELIARLLVARLLVTRLLVARLLVARLLVARLLVGWVERAAKPVMQP